MGTSHQFVAWENSFISPHGLVALKCYWGEGINHSIKYGTFTEHIVLLGKHQEFPRLVVVYFGGRDVEKPYQRHVSLYRNQWPKFLWRFIVTFYLSESAVWELSCQHNSLVPTLEACKCAANHISTFLGVSHTGAQRCTSMGKHWQGKSSPLQPSLANTWQTWKIGQWEGRTQEGDVLGRGGAGGEQDSEWVGEEHEVGLGTSSYVGSKLHSLGCWEQPVEVVKIK